MIWYLALTVLATLADDRLRYQVITDARGIISKGNESGLWALTERGQNGPDAWWTARVSNKRSASAQGRS
jgi:hypothetical protein